MMYSLEVGMTEGAFHLLDVYGFSEGPLLWSLGVPNVESLMQLKGLKGQQCAVEKDQKALKYGCSRCPAY